MAVVVVVAHTAVRFREAPASAKAGNNTQATARHWGDASRSSSDAHLQGREAAQEVVELRGGAADAERVLDAGEVGRQRL